MALRSLLVPIGAQPADEIVLDSALTLGENFKSHISVVFVRPNPTEVVRYATEWSYPILTEDAVAIAERHSLELSRGAHRIFERWRARHELPVAASPTDHEGVTVSWHEHVGPSGTVLRDLARFADLVVMRGLGDTGPIDGDEMMEAIIFDCGRPALLIPGTPVDTLSGTALVAWDGAREALHAVAAALPLLARMGTVRILSVDGDSTTKAEELAAYMAWHGVVAEIHNAVRGAATVGEVVLREAEAMGAGLLVMGGYHHGRTREIVFGGTTRHVTAAGHIPVLIAH